jgi:hypothetical protein
MCRSKKMKKKKILFKSVVILLLHEKKMTSSTVDENNKNQQQQQQRAFRSKEDQEIRETFLELRKECFELEKIKFKRMREAAQQRMTGGAQLPEIDGMDDGEKKNQRQPIGVFENWKRVIILTAIILLLNARRILNLIDLAFNPSTTTTSAELVSEKS